MATLIPSTESSLEPREVIERPKETRDRLFLKTLLTSKVKVTPEEVAHFREHPEEIDEITAPVNVHKAFLAFGILIGLVFVAASKWAKYADAFADHDLFGEFVIDIAFEIGVALIGAGVTAYLLGILLNEQQRRAKLWRAAIRVAIREPADAPVERAP